MKPTNNQNFQEKATFITFRATAISLLARRELASIGFTGYMLKKQPCWIEGTIPIEHELAEGQSLQGKFKTSCNRAATQN